MLAYRRMHSSITSITPPCTTIPFCCNTKHLVIWSMPDISSAISLYSILVDTSLYSDPLPTSSFKVHTDVAEIAEALRYGFCSTNPQQITAHYM